MSNQFTVGAGEHEAHYRSLSEYADRVEQAGREGQSIGVGIDTYGIIGQAFSAEARRVTSGTAKAITRFADSIRDLSQAVRTAGQAYHDCDQGVADALGGQGGGVSV